MKNALLQGLAATEHWAIHRPVFDRLVQLAARAGDLSRQTIKATLSDPTEGIGVSAPPTVAVIPIRGIIEPRRSFWTEYFGGTALESLHVQFQKALADDTVKSIVFDVCSPGGDAVGVEEMANEIRAARGRKPMLSVCNCRAASAAYWLGCQADEFVGLQAAAECGSVGVFCCHIDVSALNEMVGIRPTYIFAGAHKVEGNPDEPLSDEAQAFYQGQVDNIYARFVASVAKGRGVTPAKVKADFGQGRCYLVPQAVALGMLDRQGTLEGVIASAATGRPRRSAREIADRRLVGLATGEDAAIARDREWLDTF
jgi:signal peptide peptidase SppA